MQVLLALAFAAVGIYQLLSHDIWWNRSLMVSNAFSSFFRVNSIFYDPSIFGRYLAATIALVFAALLFGSVRRPLRAGVAAGLAWIGILTSYSQSSMVALSASVAAGLVLTYGRRLAYLLLLAAAVLGLGLLATPTVRHANLQELTSTRPGCGRRPAAVPRPPDRRRRPGRLDRRRARPHAARPDRAPRAARHAPDGRLGARDRRPRARDLALAVLARLALERGAQRRSGALGLALLAILVHSCFYAAFF